MVIYLVRNKKTGQFATSAGTFIFGEIEKGRFYNGLGGARNCVTCLVGQAKSYGQNLKRSDLEIVEFELVEKQIIKDSKK